MKVFFAVLLTILLPSVAVLASPPAASPLIGSWAVDIARLPVPPQARPKSVTFTFSESSDGMLKMQVHIVGPDGSESHSIATASLDGEAVPVSGSMEADVAAVKMPAPNVLVLMLAKEKAPASTRIFTVSADGKTMIETAAYFGPEGRPLMRTNHFSRIQ